MGGDSGLEWDRARSLPADVVRPARVARALRSPLRRIALAVVLERSAPVHVADLGAAVLAESPGREEQPGRGGLRRSLHGRHLPLLAGAGLVDRSENGDLVRPGDHPLLSRGAFEPARLREDPTPWDAMAAVFGRPRRRIGIRTLTRLDAPIELHLLARSLAAELVGDLGPDAAILDDVATRLHHVDLPLLANAEVVEYDARTRTVESVSTAHLPVQVPVA